MAARRDRFVVITGGAGFVGSNLADRLLRDGERVLIYDSLARPGTELNVEWLTSRYPSQVEVVLADVRDSRAVWKAVQSAKSVFHLAAQVAVTTSLIEPLADFEVNAAGTLNVLEAARSMSDPPPVLFTSTNKVYGELAGFATLLEEGRYRFRGARQAVDESAPLDFHSPYGCSKGAADQYVLDYARIFGVPTAVFRMSCIYGPRQFGNEDQGWVAHFAISALAGRPVTIYGDGRQVRDILYVDDLVDAMLAASSASGLHPGRVYNVGGGAQNAVSLLEVLALLQQQVARPVTRTHGEWRPGDQRIYVTDTARIERELGWRPRVGKQEGIRRLTEWLRENHPALAAPAVAAVGRSA